MNAALSLRFALATWAAGTAPAQAPPQWFTAAPGKNAFDLGALSPTHADFADMNGDGRLDAVFSGPRVLLRRGGRFEPVGSAQGGSAQGPERSDAVVVGDVDGDGDVDVVQSAGGRIGLFVNDGTGVLADVTAAQIPFGGQVGIRRPGVLLVDIDADGDLDILSSDGHAWVNDGAGRFADESASRLPLVSTPSLTTLAAADVDLDGDTDVVLDSRVMLNDGVGFFTAVSANIGRLSSRFSWLDVDRDGDPDLVAAGGWFLVNDGQGGFVQTQIAGISPSAFTVRTFAADVDGDGFRDVLIAGNNVQAVWHPSTGPSAFGPAQPLPFAVPEVIDLHPVDLDGDGALDVVGLGATAEGKVPPQALFHDGVAPRVQGTVVADATSRFARLDYLADLTGDGAPEFVYSGVVYENDGTGWLRSVATLPVVLSQGYRVVAAGDWDGDGLRDLAVLVGQPWTGYEMRFLRHQGHLQFATAGTHAVGTASMFQPAVIAAASADFDGDGDEDLVTTGSRLRLWTNNGSGGFSRTQIDSLGGRASGPLWAHDFDGDGRRDFAVVTGVPATLSAPELLVFTNGGGGTFSSATLPSPANVVADLTGADANGDGVLDLVAVGVAGQNSPATVYLGGAGGTFSQAAWSLPEGPIVFADLDGDGIADLAEAGPWPVVSRGDGAGGFVPTAALSELGTTGMTTETRALRGVDLDGDRDIDLVQFGHASGGTERLVTIYRNRTRDLQVPGISRPGGLLTARLTSVGAAQDRLRVAAVWVGLQLDPLPVPGVGTVLVDPNAGLVVGIELFAGREALDLSLPIPNAPVFAGLDLFLQGAIVRGNGAIELCGLGRDTTF